MPKSVEFQQQWEICKELLAMGWFHDLMEHLNPLTFWFLSRTTQEAARVIFHAAQCSMKPWLPAEQLPLLQLSRALHPL